MATLATLATLDVSRRRPGGRRVSTTTTLHVVQDPAGRRISLGDAQAAWLLEKGLIQGEPPLYTTLRTIFDINDRVLAEPTLLQCDFCHARPAPWFIRTRPFEVAAGPIGEHRPIYACDRCVALVRTNRKTELVTEAVRTIVADCRANGVLRPDVPNRVAVDTIRPMVREVVYGMFANRRGWPMRVADDAA